MLADINENHTSILTIERPNVVAPAVVLQDTVRGLLQTFRLGGQQATRKNNDVNAPKPTWPRAKTYFAGVSITFSCPKPFHTFGVLHQANTFRRTDMYQINQWH